MHLCHTIMVVYICILCHRWQTGNGTLVISDVFFDIDCKAESQSLPGNAVHDPPCVVVSQCPAELLVRHAWLVLASPPQLGNSVGSDDLELVAVSGPLDDGAVVGCEEEVEEKLPQLNVALVWRGRDEEREERRRVV